MRRLRPRLAPSNRRRLRRSRRTRCLSRLREPVPAGALASPEQSSRVQGRRSRSHRAGPFSPIEEEENEIALPPRGITVWAHLPCLNVWQRESAALNGINRGGSGAITVAHRIGWPCSERPTCDSAHGPAQQGKRTRARRRVPWSTRYWPATAPMAESSGRAPSQSSD